ncbi:MAG: type II toxin-antitoxin system PemK/MazF family toxin [Clostridia bacterium]|nr:type II toxin-antitoxin system PemK/MazF family toxin [Deltaproteobacteria bacterium]
MTGKPRPAVVIESNQLMPHPTVIVVPFTSELSERPLPFTRLTIDPTPSNALTRVSQIMIERLPGVPAVHLRPTGGCLEDDKLTELTRLLALWLGIGERQRRQVSTARTTLTVSIAATLIGSHGNVRNEKRDSGSDLRKGFERAR